MTTKICKEHKVSHDIQQETLDECGIKKGCIFHPDGCRLPKCLLALTYNFTGEVIEYEISSFLKENMSNRYIAIGFSDDQEMGNDSVIYCQASKTMDPEIGLGYTTTKNFKIIEDVITVKKILQNQETGIINGTMTCRFLQKIWDENPELHMKSLYTPHYIFLVHGLIDEQSGNFQIHSTSHDSDMYPYISPGKIIIATTHKPFTNIHSGIITKKSSSPLKRNIIKAHGCLMLTGWWIFLPSGILFARYLKCLLPAQLIYGKKIWFLMHMTLNTIGSLLIAISFTCVFIAENGKWTGKNFPKGTHAILGMTASIGAFLQPIMGIYRCTPKHKLRIFLNSAKTMFSAASIWCVTYPPFSYKLGVNEDYGIVPRSLIITFWVITKVQLATVIGFILIALIFVSGLHVFLLALYLLIRVKTCTGQLSALLTKLKAPFPSELRKLYTAASTGLDEQKL
ncbi:putative ferric-chelate reductase 1 [Trichinella pseudospiralis]|uniref:Putative ferric-chelate reductase 1 n=1 Tax=Trichinella pseudospiralis TaxID=6337 RepID=A0A0V1FFJ6_TRIPS|nr:putative ferric-chelate reductase 1 [Trichinella pseudospiralis]